jgi:hypothetical protein
MRIIAPNGASYVTQPEFNTAIALFSSAQNNIDVSLESLYENRNCNVHVYSYIHGYTNSCFFLYYY